MRRSTWSQPSRKQALKAFCCVARSVVPRVDRTPTATCRRLPGGTARSPSVESDAMESSITPIGKGEVLLHVGLHKTGTTALQVALADARGFSRTMTSATR